MSDYVDGGSSAKMSSLGECGVVLPTPPPYSHMMMTGAPPPPSYWSHQQQQQMAAQNSMANSQQLMEMPPSTSQNIQNFPQQSGFSQHPDLINQPSAFNGMSSNSPAFFQQQQFQDFQKFPSSINISPGGQFGANGSNNGIGQMGGGQQQISSPSVTSTADLVQNSGGGTFMPGNNQMMFGFQQQQQQPQSFIPPPNGFPGPPNNAHSESEINSTQLGQSDSPMLTNRQFPHSGQTSFPSPVPMAGQQQPRWPIHQMGMPNGGGGPQFQQFNQPGNGNAGSSPRFPMLSGVMAQQMMGPPQLLMSGSGTVGRRSFLFTTEMANKAASDLQQQPAFDMAQWHLRVLPQWHQQNPSTSRAGFEQQPIQMLQPQQPTAGNIAVPANNVGRSPPTAQSRSTKRKASAQTTAPQEQQQQSQSQLAHNSVNSPSIVPSTPNSFGHPQSVPATIDGHGQQQRHSSIDICDSSTNGEFFKRPPSRMPNGGLGMPTSANCFISPNPGQPMANNCFGRMDDENPLKKMEIMTSKTLNEQPATKMARLMGGMDDEQQQQQQQQQQTQHSIVDYAKQDKMRKLHEIEKALSQCPSSDNSPSMGPGQSQLPHGFIQMHQNGSFCQLPPPAGPHPSMAMPSFPSDQLPPQFRPSSFFPGQMIPHAQDGIASGLGHMPMPPSTMTDNSSSPSSAPFFHFPQRFPPPIRMPNGLLQNQHAQFFGGPEQNGQICGDYSGSTWMADGGPPSQSSMDGGMASMKMVNPQNQQQQMMATGGGAQMQG